MYYENLNHDCVITGASCLIIVEDVEVKSQHQIWTVNEITTVTVAKVYVDHPTLLKPMSHDLQHGRETLY